MSVHLPFSQKALKQLSTQYRRYWEATTKKSGLRPDFSIALPYPGLYNDRVNLETFLPFSENAVNF